MVLCKRYIPVSWTSWAQPCFLWSVCSDLPPHAHSPSSAYEPESQFLFGSGIWPVMGKLFHSKIVVVVRCWLTFLRTSSLSLKFSNVTSTGLVPLTSGPSHLFFRNISGKTITGESWACFMFQGKFMFYHCCSLPLCLRPKHCASSSNILWKGFLSVPIISLI